jgi:DNA mismatch endonuclease (patch repair protein)
MMARVRSKDTKPEMMVRRACWKHGLRYRLHDRTLPGHPDLVFRSRRLVVFVHGCFWHAHQGCARHTLPKTRPEWWAAKIARNQQRDAKVLAALASMGWETIVVWECEVGDALKLNDVVCAIKAMPRREGKAHAV